MKKTILITGANKGIGFETARQLAKSGHRILVSARDNTRLQDALQSLNREGLEAEGLLMDVSHSNSILDASLQLQKKKVKLDVLINNAAILFKNDDDLLESDEAILEQTLATNSLGPLRVCRAFLAMMKNPGRIINVSSGGGSMTDPVGGWSPAYCVSKTLLNAVTRQLAYELVSRNISVNAVCPGWVRTSMGGRSATRLVAKGAETPVWLALEAPQEATGRFFRDKHEIPW